MTSTKTKRFDAVLESRRWKAAVSQQTQGMTRGEVLTFFSKERVISTLAEMRDAGGSAIVREEPPAQ